MKNLIVSAAVVALATSAASAQQAVQWRVEDGGNGHWYEREGQPLNWPDARDRAVAAGGHLVTIRSSAEFQYISTALGLQSDLFWIGGFQPKGSCEPGCGWQWVTNEPWDYTNWNWSEPSNSNGNENWLECYPGGLWNDHGDSLKVSVREWSADCNGDGIVDYGQCRDGSLPDYNGNNIPDCCENGTPCEVGSYPVQWRVEDGGNGHWYQFITVGADCWDEARTYCETREGYLATLVTESESTFVRSHHPNDGHCHWIGGFQDLKADDFAEPAGGWRWVTGEPWTPLWDSTQPENGGGDQNVACVYAFGMHDTWACTGATSWPLVIEWSTDCNNDGIVDYGQCRDGSLPDYNGNNVPDCCEAGTPCEVGNYPVQWRVEDGGNGHWYQAVAFVQTWDDAASLATSRGGHLASLTSDGENEFATTLLLATPNGRAYVGLSQLDGQTLPGDGWYWATGEPLSYTNWFCFGGAMGCAPIDTPCWQKPWRHENDQQNIGVLTRDGTWVDVERGLGCDAHVVSRAALIEWSADCNNDGIVDYGQIVQGQLVDANNNGVPDSCEVDPCPADTNNSGAVNGVDLAIVLGAWGTNGQGDGDADINNDGIVNGQDLAFVLGGWGPCP